MALYWSRVYWAWWGFVGDGRLWRTGRRVEWDMGWRGGRIGHWCSLTHFCSYKHTREGDDLLIMFVFSSFLPD